MSFFQVIRKRFTGFTSHSPTPLSFRLMAGGMSSGFRNCANVGSTMPRSRQRAAVRLMTSGCRRLMILDMARKSYEETLQKGMAEKSREFEEKGAEIYSKAYNRHMASHRITETELFKLLKKQEAREGFEAAEVSSRVSAVAGEVWPLLQQVSRSFPLYTLHDPEHSFRVAENMAKLIPKRTLNQLNSVEISVLLYAAYLHDIGMAASQDQFYEWLKSNDYEAFIAAHENWESAIRFHERRHERIDEEKPPTKTSDDLTLRQLQDVAYTDYLRETHAQRGADFIMGRFGLKGQWGTKIQVQEGDGKGTRLNS